MMLTLLSQGWFIAVFTACIAAAFMVALINLRANKVSRVAGVRRKSSMLTLSEKKLFANLCDALDHDFHIFAKVGVLDVVERGARLSARRYKNLRKMLGSERFDYVVCRKSDLSIAAIIELECFERGVSCARKRQRTSLISELCKTSKLKLFFFDPRQDYLGTDIRRLITGSSTCTNPLSEKPVKRSNNWSGDLTSESMMTEYVGKNSCPDCNSELVTKMAMKGKNIGDRFLMCRKYPYCEYRVLLDDLKVLDIRSASVGASSPLSKHAASKKSSTGQINPAQKKRLNVGYSDWSD